MSYSDIPNLPEGGIESPMAHDASLSPTQPLSAEQPQTASSSAVEIQSAVGHRNDPHHCLVSACFEKQPPDNMRKSNFFHFIISLYDMQHNPIQVQHAVFKDFYDTVVDGQEYRNGLVYTLSLIYSDGTHKEEEMYVRLIDAATKQMIPYEGTCKNPDFRRVLLTHELICSRCLEHRSCGNKNDTPSDPIILDSYRLKIFAKCNQNCLKNAGNPKDSRRRFQVALYASDIINGPPVATSESMFVHNNSKHGRRPPYSTTLVGDGKPCIVSIYPSDGWITGNTRITVIGVNFFEGLDVVFGTVPVQSEVLSPNAIAVRVPPASMPGEVDITLLFRASGAQFCVSNPGKFLYTASEEQSFENSFCRIERIVRHPDDPDELPKDIMLQRAAELLETHIPLSRAGPHSTPFNQTSLFPYPRSPFFSNNGLFLLTPQPLTPRFNAAMPGAEAASYHSHLQQPNPLSNNYLHQAVSTSGEHGVLNAGHTQQARQPYPHPPTAFPFPEVHHHGDEAVSEVKAEPTQITSPMGGHKQTLTHGGPLFMPFVPMTQVGYDSSFGSSLGSIPLSHSGQCNSNSNNNNSSSTRESMAPTTQNNSLSYVPRFFPGALPPSPGFIVAPPFSPVHLPTTPTGGNGPIFNFGTPILSPTKSGLVGTRPIPLNLSTSEASTGLSLPSPQHGVFHFPPITPTALIAPISLPDLTGTNNDDASSDISAGGASTGDSPSRAKKRKVDKSPAASS